MSAPGSTGQDAADPDAAGPGTPAPARAPIRLLQLTDLHLYADPDGRLLGQNTRRTFAAVLALAMSKDWPPDAVVLTGDLVHDERIEGYQFLTQRLAELQVPCHCIPGNHDRVTLLASSLDPDAIAGLRIVAIGDWDLALLDSTVPFAEGGHLPERILQGLEQQLAGSNGRHTLVCLHHQPVPVGSRWMDGMMVDNGDALIALAARYINLRGILWGHVHQIFEQVMHDTLLLATPSTCVQFLPHSDGFALDTATPGYRWLDLHPDGCIVTGVERVHSYPDPLVQRSEGY
jgi:Icc protein